MVLDTVLPVLGWFVVVATGAYVGTLRALNVYFRGDDTVFLPDDYEPPNLR